MSSTPTYIILKLLRGKSKEKYWKPAREKWVITKKAISVRWSADFLWETIQISQPSRKPSFFLFTQPASHLFTHFFIQLCFSPSVHTLVHSLIHQQIWKTQQWPQDWKRSVFIPIQKKGNVKECSNYCTIALISHASKVMLKIMQARLQQYANRELPDVQAGFRKSRGTKDQTANVHWIIEKAREFQKNILLLLYWLYQSLWLCGPQQTLENS